MDFSKITNNIVNTSKKWKDSILQAGKKTLQFTWGQLSSTSLFIDHEDAYNQMLEQKRVVFVAFDEDHDVMNEIILLMPVWASKAFTDISTVKYLNRETSGAVISAKGYQMPVEMRVYFQWQEVHRFNDMKAINEWWKHRDYGENLQNSPSEATNPTQIEWWDATTDVPSETSPPNSDPLLTIKT